MSENKKKIISLELPEFAFLMGSGHEPKGDVLKGRNVLIHMRTASVIEIFHTENVALNEDVRTYKFFYTNRLGGKEKMIAALHFCKAEDYAYDPDYTRQYILRPAAVWFCQYCSWEDNQIPLDDIAKGLFGDEN